MENKSEKITVNKEELRKRLTPLQYQVTQEAGTERPFTGAGFNKVKLNYVKDPQPISQSEYFRLLQQALREGRISMHCLSSGSVQLGYQIRFGLRLASIQRCAR